MNNKSHKNEINDLISASMEIQDMPSPELNERLIANLYRQQDIIKQEAPMRCISLWYVPMIVNFVMFSLLGVLALTMVTNPYFSKFLACICIYAGFAGIILTIVGMKRTNIKKEIAVRIKKGGVLA